MSQTQFFNRHLPQARAGFEVSWLVHVLGVQAVASPHSSCLADVSFGNAQLGNCRKCTAASFTSATYGGKTEDSELSASVQTTISQVLISVRLLRFADALAALTARRELLAAASLLFRCRLAAFSLCVASTQEECGNEILLLLKAAALLLLLLLQLAAASGAI